MAAGSSMSRAGLPSGTIYLTGLEDTCSTKKTTFVLEGLDGWIRTGIGVLGPLSDGDFADLLIRWV